MNFDWGKKFFPLTKGKKLVTLAIMISKVTFSRGSWHPTPSNLEKFL